MVLSLDFMPRAMRKSDLGRPSTCEGVRLCGDWHARDDSEGVGDRGTETTHLAEERQGGLVGLAVLCLRCDAHFDRFVCQRRHALAGFTGARLHMALEIDEPERVLFRSRHVANGARRHGGGGWTMEKGGQLMRRGG